MILVPLSQERFAMIDDEDADLLAFKWHALKSGKTFYARRNYRKPDGARGMQFLHRAVALRMGITGEVDHRNRHGLDCTRGNLRPATRRQNLTNQGLRIDNTSGVKGVYWRGDVGRWQVRQRVDGSLRSLGYYTDLAEAEAVARAARDKLHGEYACHGVG